MNKYITTSLVALAAIGTQAQDINIKKNVINVNKTPVAKIEREKFRYKISSLDDQMYFWAEIVNNADADKFWLQLTGENGNIHDFENLNKSVSLSREKTFVNAVFHSTQGLIPETGFNKENVEALFKTANTEISDKWKEIDNTRRQQKTEEQNLMKEDKITITATGNVLRGDEKIGTIKTLSETQVYTKHTATIFDIKGNEIATVKYDEGRITNARNGVKINTFDFKAIDLYDLNYFMDKAEPAKANQAIIARLYANGYKLGDMTQQISNYKNAKYAERQEKHEQKVEENKQNSLNIYDIEGYVIDKKGVKHEGLVTIEFESVQNKSKNSGIADLTSYGNSVSIKVGNKKMSFKAKDNVEFGVQKDRFLGLSTSSDGGLNNSNGELDLFGGSNKFLLVDFEKDGNYVLHHIKTPNDYYLFIKGQKNAIYLGDKATFGTRKPEDAKKLFDKYMNCSALNYEDHDTVSKDGLIQLIEAYIKACK